MPKTANNSTPCSCCHRLMPRKAGKRATCSPRCRRIGRPWKDPRGAGRYITESKSGHRTLTSRADFFPLQEFKSANGVFGQKPDVQPEGRNPVPAAVFGSEKSRAEFVLGDDPAALPGLRLTVDLGPSWGVRWG